LSLELTQAALIDQALMGHPFALALFADQLSYRGVCELFPRLLLDLLGSGRM